MIGLIGPPDSVRRALLIAEEEGREGEVLAREYATPDDAVAIAKEIDTLCRVILFTGQVPFSVVEAGASLQAEAQFISHSGADLHNALARILIEKRGMMPRVSVDTISAVTVRDVFEDVGLPVPDYVLPLVSNEGNLVSRRSREVAEFHISRFESGKVDACLACLAGTYEELHTAGIPVWRIEHSRVTTREALRRAWLSSELLESRSTQLAVVIAEADGESVRGRDSYEREATRLRVHQDLLKQAKKVSGRLTALDDTTFLITTSRDAVEDAIARFRRGQASLLAPNDLGSKLNLGLGVGGTVALAEENARRALALTKRSGHTNVVFPDGDVYSTADERKGHRMRLQETAPAVLDLSRRIGIGPLSIRRLVETLSRVDHKAVTAQQLAATYGVQPRSARRILASLRSAGLASEAGVRVHPGAGRPQTVYRIDLPRLRAAFEAHSGVSAMTSGQRG